MEKDTDRTKDTEGHFIRGRYTPESEDAEGDGEREAFRRGAAEPEDQPGPNTEGHGRSF